MEHSEAETKLTPDRTFDAKIALPATLVDGGLHLYVETPAEMAAGESLFGRYLLARCGAQSVLERRTSWQFALRRTLYPIRRRVVANGTAAQWELYTPTFAHPGLEWLSQRAPGESINLLGPLGLDREILPQDRNLLLIADPSAFPLLFPVIDSHLDRNGRISLIVRTSSSPTGVRSMLPMEIELRTAADTGELVKCLEELLRWADHLCAAYADGAYQTLADQIRMHRFHLQPAFAHVVVPSTIVCGVGACLACVIPARSSFTRACIHGPIFDLTDITF